MSVYFVSIYFFIDSVRKFLDTPSYACAGIIWNCGYETPMFYFSLSVGSRECEERFKGA